MAGRDEGRAPPPLRPAPRPSPRRRWTVLLVPEGGGGPARQVRLGAGALRLLAGGAVLAVALAVLGGLSFLRELDGIEQRDALLRENLALKQELREVEARLDELDAALMRLRLYRSQLEDVDAGALPGWGPVDEDDRAAAAEADLDWSGDTGLPPEPGELGDPMGEAGLDDAAPTGDAAWAEALARRLDDTLDGLEAAEPALGELVESAEEWRAMQAALPTSWPVQGTLTSGFGYRRSPFNHRVKFHRGIDIYAPVGTPIRAPAPGVVITARWSSGYGRMLEIDHGYGIVTRYAHTSRIYVHVGDEVRRGQRIAAVGRTGHVTGPHLHFEVYVDGEPVDPLAYLE